MAVGFARAGALVVRVRRAVDEERGRNGVVAQAVQEHGGPAPGDMLPSGPTQFAIQLDTKQAKRVGGAHFGGPVKSGLPET